MLYRVTGSTYQGTTTASLAVALHVPTPSLSSALPRPHLSHMQSVPTLAKHKSYDAHPVGGIIGSQQARVQSCTEPQPCLIQVGVTRKRCRGRCRRQGRQSLPFSPGQDYFMPHITQQGLSRAAIGTRCYHPA